MTPTLENSIHFERDGDSIVCYLKTEWHSKHTLMTIHPKRRKGKYLVSARDGSERAAAYAEMLGECHNKRLTPYCDYNGTLLSHINLRWIVSDEELAWLFNWELAHVEECRDGYGVDYYPVYR